jgi:hypothetical protein
MFTLLRHGYASWYPVCLKLEWEPANEFCFIIYNGTTGLYLLLLSVNEPHVGHFLDMAELHSFKDFVCFNYCYLYIY